MAGAYGGYAIFLAGDLSEPGRSDLASTALSAAVAALAVVVAALFLEYVCRVPGDGPRPSRAAGTAGRPAG